MASTVLKTSTVLSPLVLSCPGVTSFPAESKRKDNAAKNKNPYEPELNANKDVHDHWDWGTQKLSYTDL